MAVTLRARINQTKNALGSVSNAGHPHAPTIGTSTRADGHGDTTNRFVDTLLGSAHRTHSISLA
jgi:hypothetical protein